MAEVFSDDLILKIGDLLSNPLYPASSQPCARPFMLVRPIQAHSCFFAHAPVYACAPDSRSHPLLKAIFLTPSLVYFRNQKLSKEYKHFISPTPLNP